MTMETLLTGNTTVWPALTEAIREARSGDRRAARYAIAFVGKGASSRLRLRRGDMLICDASDDAVRLGLTSVDELEAMRLSGVRVYSRKGLHAKVGVVGDMSFVGSANATAGSDQHRNEALLISRRPAVRHQLEAYIGDLRASPSRRVTEADVERMRQLPVKPVRFPGTTPVRPVLDPDGRVWLCEWTEDRRSTQREESQVEQVQGESGGLHGADRVEATRLESDSELAQWKVGDYIVWFNADDKSIPPPHRVIQKAPSAYGALHD